MTKFEMCQKFALVPEISFDLRWNIKLIVVTISLFLEDYFSKLSYSCGYKVYRLNIAALTNSLQTCNNNANLLYLS